MPKHIRAGALALLATAAIAVPTVLAAPAGAAPVGATPAGAARAGGAAANTLGFLTAKDLPPHATSAWTAGPVTPGASPEVEQDRCLSMALGGGRHSWYRDFHTDLDTSARQVTVDQPSVRAAKGLFSRVNKDIRSCAGWIERADPETEATLRDYGTLDVEEGAHVYGLHTETSWGATDIRLLSVGRDGKTVTVVDWGQLGDFADAPVKAFKKTTTTAVDKLH